MAPHFGDVLVRDVAAAKGYIVVDAMTRQTVGGPYLSLADATRTARHVCRNGRIWREWVDSRGRPLGPPFLLARLAFPRQG